MYKVYYKPDKSDIYYPHRNGSESIWVTEVGKSSPWQNYQPAVLYRNVYILHYVRSGTGTYLGQKIKGPCVFLMIPDTPHHYKVDSDSPPYEQFWIKFQGPRAESFIKKAGFTIDTAVHPCPYIEEAWKTLADLTTPDNYIGNDDSFYMLSGLFKLFSLHSACVNKYSAGKQLSVYSEKILEHIHRHYDMPINESDLAELVHLSVNYMHRIFVRENGITPIHYLNRYRISCAKRLLRETDLPVSKIAESVGFSSGDYFCRVFQKFNNSLSPTKYRKN